VTCRQGRPGPGRARLLPKRQAVAVRGQGGCILLRRRTVLPVLAQTRAHRRGEKRTRTSFIDGGAKAAGHDRTPGVGRGVCPSPSSGEAEGQRAARVGSRRARTLPVSYSSLPPPHFAAKHLLRRPGSNTSSYRRYREVARVLFPLQLTSGLREFTSYTQQSATPTSPQPVTIDHKDGINQGSCGFPWCPAWGCTINTGVARRRRDVGCRGPCSPLPLLLRRPRRRVGGPALCESGWGSSSHSRDWGTGPAH
jgi:hypothetical protein